MRTFISLLALAAAATSAPASPPTSNYASAYSYQNINRNGYGDSYDIEYAVKGTDYKGEPLDFNARESKDGYNTEGEYYAVLPQGWMCVAYAVGEGGAGLKYDCQTSQGYKETPKPSRPVYNPPVTARPVYTPPPRPYTTPRPVYNPPPVVYNTPRPVYNPPPVVYTTPRPIYNPPPVTYPPTTEKPKPRMVKVIYETYLPEDLANHPDTFELQHKHPHDNYHHTIPLTRISTHPTDILYDKPIYREHQ